MRALAILVLSAVSSGLALRPAAAGTLQELTLDQMAEKSTSIVRAKIMGSSAVARGTDVYTVYRFETLETIKGVSAGEMAVPGGVAGGIRQVAEGAPALSAGREYVLFLWASRRGLTQLTGMSQGLFRVERTASGEVVASRARASEPMLDNAGRPVQDVALSMPWPELKAKIVQALARESAGTAARAGSAGGR